jgi:hypothetical protein
LATKSGIAAKSAAESATAYSLLASTARRTIIASTATSTTAAFDRFFGNFSPESIADFDGYF